MSRQATLFHSWGSGSQKKGSQHAGAVKVGRLKTADALENDELDDEDLLLAIAMEESLKDLPQPDVGPSASSDVPRVCSALSDSKKEALMKKQSLLFKSVTSSETARSTDQCDNKQNNALGPDDTLADLPDISNVEELPGFDTYAGRMWIYPTNLPVREYQFSIVKEALFKNTLVVLPTGLGKTFIAAVIMYNYYRWYPQGKVIFMAPTKPLVAQQIEACYNIMGIPQEDTAEMTGAMQPNERQKIWRERRVFFLTPQVLTNDLSRNTCPAERVKCLVVDEAHKALGNHAYCQVVRELVKYSSNFRVLALSATPGTDIKAVQQVLNNLLIAHVELRSEDSKDLQQYTYERKVEKIVVPLDDELKSVQEKYLQILDAVVSRLKRQGVLYNRETKSMSKFLILKARDAFRQNPPVNLQHQHFGVIEGDFALCMSLYHGYELLQLHGLRSLYNFLEGIMNGEKAYGRTRSELQKNVAFCELLKSLRDKFDHVRCLDPNVSFRSQSAPTEQKPVALGHPKMKCLETVVLEHFNKYQQDLSTSSGPSTRIMIFSQYRDSVNEISEMLHRHRPLVKVMSFVGQSSVGKSSRGFTQKEQLKVMKKFREGGYNTLVSTCVGEEGLDIGDVDLIICFDAHKSPIRLVQRMGRTGRKRKGRIVMLVTEGKEEQIYNQSQYNKKSIHKAILNGAKSLVYYPNNPAMVPKGLTPVCHKMHLTVQTDYKAQSKGKDRSLQRNKLQTLGKSVLSKRTGTIRAAADGLLTEADMEYWATHYRLPSSETPFLPESEFLTLPPHKNKPVNQEGIELSLSDWMPWQNRLQTTVMSGHSDVTRLLVDVIEFMDLLSAVGTDEDTYGQEMALYLNEDDILKPGESNEDHGILKFCNRAKPGVSEDMSKAGVKSIAGKSKHRSSVLPQLHDDPVLVGSDDEELPVIGARVEHSHVFADDKRTEDKPNEVTDDKSTHKTSGNKLNAFTFIETSGEDQSKTDQQKSIIDLNINKQKNSLRQSEIQTDPFSTVHNAAALDDEDDDDFQDAAIIVKERESLDGKTKSMSGPLGKKQTHCHSSAVAELAASAVCSSGSDDDKQNVVLKRNGLKSVVDEEELRLLELLPLSSSPEKGIDYLSETETDRITSPPCLDEMHLVFEQLDKKGHISPVNVLDMVDKWERPASAVCNNEISNLKNSRVWCEHDQNDCEMSVPFLPLEQPILSSQKDREMKLTGESLTRMCDRSISPRTERPLTEQRISEENKKQKNDSEIQAVVKKPPDGSLNVCDEAGKQPTHGALDGTLVHPDLQRTPAKKRMHDYNSTDVKQISDNLVDTQDANTNLMLHRFGETSLDMNDFCEPFTMEATSSKHTDVMFEHPAAEVVSYRKSPLPVAAVTRECTSTPVPDQGNDRLLSKTNKLYDEGDLFEDDDDDMFVDVSCNIPESKPTMSNAIGDKSQLTFTQALHCLDVTMDSSGKDCRVKKNSDGSHLPEVTSVDRNASSYLKDETDKIKVESNIMQTEKISQSNNSSQVNEPQFDLGFDLDFDLDEFEDEIVPPSPEHMTRPARLRHLDKSTFWTGNQTDLATSVNSVPQSAALVPALAAEVKSSSSINREVKPSFKLLHRPVAVVAPSGDAVVAPQETKQPEDGRRNEKQSSTLTFATPIRKLDEPISKDDLSDEADESLIKVSSRRPRANVLASPDTQRDVVSEPTEQNPFKTPMKPALRSHKSMKFHKRLRVSSGDDDDDDNDDGNSNNDESPIIRPKPRKTLRVNSILVDDDNDDFTEAGMPRIEKSRKKPALSAKNRIPLKKSKYSSRPLSNFIEHEAEVSGSEGSVSSDESDGSDLDQFDASFINDMSQMSQVCGSVDMKAVYLQSVHSPACRGQYKIAYGKGADVDVYSQIPEDESEYMEDSFCVANDFEEKEVNDTAVETSVLGSRAAKLQGAQKLKFAELRTRRMLKKKSTDGNFNNKETCGRVSENWMVGRNHKCNKQTVESSSEDELVKQKYDYQGDKRENAQLEGDLSGVAPGPQAHHSVSSDDCSPPLLSLKSRIRRKLAPLDRTESGHSSHGVMSRTKTQEHNQFRSNPMRTDRVETKVTKPLETPLFSLGLADLDLDLDDDGLEEIGTELQSDKDASCRLVQNDLANEETMKQSGVMSFSLAGNDVNRVSSFGVFINPEVTSTNVSPPSVQSRQERLRLSRLKQEEFRKKFTHQKTCGNESNQSHESGISDISVGEFDKSKIDLCPVINKNNSQISIDNNDQFNKTSFTNIKEKLVVLVDSREITAAQNLVSTLRFNHNLHISVKSLGNCDYIVSNRMAIERKTVSDFTNGANKKKLLDRLRLLCELFDRPCLIVEKDRVRPGQKEPTKPLLCSRYVQHVVSCLAQTHIKLLYSDNDQETASLIAALCLQEQKKNMAITCNVELSQSQEQVLNFYLSFPKVNYALALKLLNSFTSISEFIKSSVIVLEKKLAVSQQKAKELYLYVRHRFNPELAKTNTTTAMPSANR